MIRDLHFNFLTPRSHKGYYWKIFIAIITIVIKVAQHQK